MQRGHLQLRIIFEIYRRGFGAIEVKDGRACAVGSGQGTGTHSGSVFAGIEGIDVAVAVPCYDQIIPRCVQRGRRVLRIAGNSRRVI